LVVALSDGRATGAAVLALAVAGLTSRDTQTARAAYVAMEVTTWFVIVPSALASLLTGLLVSLGTPWGLFRHYWVFAKLVITIVATNLLLAHTHPIGLLAEAARDTMLSAVSPAKSRSREFCAPIRRHHAGCTW